MRSYVTFNLMESASTIIDQEFDLVPDNLLILHESPPQVLPKAR